jgi:hypothetical protein
MANMDAPADSSGEAQDPAMADTPQEPGPEDLPPEDQDQSEQPQEPQSVPDEEQEPDEYSGPTEDQAVGDSRHLMVYALRPDYEPGEAPLGDAWQDDAGQIQGSGMVAVMLFEPQAKQRYLNASLARDLSPLAILEKRLARASWFRTELLEGENEPE